MSVIDCRQLFAVLRVYSERQRGVNKVPDKAYFASIISLTRDADSRRWFAIYADREARRQAIAAHRTTGT